MTIEKNHFGTTPKGEEVFSFTLRNKSDVTIKIINYGGIILSIKVPDKKGDFDDVVLGFDNLENYLENGPYFGALIGRYDNRIQGANFTLRGKVYELVKNDGNNHLHGGTFGFHKVLWNAEIYKEDDAEKLVLTYESKDGEEGYPGNLDVKVIYSLDEDNALKIDYYAVSDKDTIVNLTNHSYFNLAGHDSGDILGHKVRIYADSFTPCDKFSIPTGEIYSVKFTPMDFTELKAVGLEIDKDFHQLLYALGYDHNWILKVSGKKPEKAAEVFEENSGRFMEVFTTKPGIQFYTGNYLDGSNIGKGGIAYRKRAGLCLETQYFPDSINHDNFPSPVLRAGEEYRNATIYKFSIK